MSNTELEIKQAQDYLLHRQTLTLSYTCPLSASGLNTQPALIWTTAGHIPSIHGIPGQTPALARVSGFAWFRIHINATWWNQQFSVANARQPTSCEVIFLDQPCEKTQQIASSSLYLTVVTDCNLWQGQTNLPYVCAKCKCKCWFPMFLHDFYIECHGGVIYCVSKGMFQKKQGSNVKFKAGSIYNMQWGSNKIIHFCSVISCTGKTW